MNNSSDLLFGPRLNRLGYLAAYGILIGMTGELGAFLYDHDLAYAAAGVSAAAFALFILACARRLRDVGLSGWWQTPINGPIAALIVLAFIPGFEEAFPSWLEWLGREPLITWFVFAFLFWLGLAAWPGQKDANRFGPPPLPLFGTIKRSA
jgi:uncharacterized membrane protein YhaH (DUF805 family)